MEIKNNLLNIDEYLIDVNPETAGTAENPLPQTITRNTILRKNV